MLNNNIELKNSQDSKIMLLDKNNDWGNKKKNSLIIANSLIRSKIKIGYNMFYCADYLLFEENETSKIFKGANFCRARLCPLCSWRRTLKIYGQVSKIVDYLDIKEEYDYIFLTLTIKNCKVGKLDDTIKLLNKGLRKLYQYKSFKKVVEGSFKALEVTFNKDTGEYHPHEHVILAVKKGYLQNHNKKVDYISQDKWALLWQKALKIDYKPIVDIRKIYGKRKQAVAEVSKYTVKTSNIIVYDEFNKLDDKHIANLHNILKGVRLTGMTGIFKDAHKLLNLQDLNDKKLNLVDTDNEEISKLNNGFEVLYKYNIGLSNYIVV